MGDLLTHASPRSPTPSPTLGTPSPHFDDAPIQMLEKDFCSNFSCCGLALADMHDLLDHFEESHVLVLNASGEPVYPPLAASDSSSSHTPLASLVIGYPQPHPPAEPSAYTYSQPQTGAASSSKPYSSASYDGYAYSDSLSELEDAYDPFGFDHFSYSPPSSDSSSSYAEYSRPSTAASTSSLDHTPLLRINTSFSSPPSLSYTPGSSNAPSPLLLSSASLARGSPDGHGHGHRRDEQRCLPPALLTLSPLERRHEHEHLPLTASLPLIESSSSFPSPTTTKSHLRHSTPKKHRRVPPAEPYSVPPSISRKQLGSAQQPALVYTNSNRVEDASSLMAVEPASVGVQRSLAPAHELVTGRPAVQATGRRRRDGREKAFKCPHPGCTKSYLNPNGLKYHLEKGTCAIDPAYAPLLSVVPPALEDDQETHAHEQEPGQDVTQSPRAPSPIALPSVPPVSPRAPSPVSSAEP
ncbi:hypothetical protein BDW22DRAFT_1364338 [Trametopsis cervina]|nr:hypothetical protein BDW22DRAFT_1364338 [Trametopsis cervina]